MPKVKENNLSIKDNSDKKRKLNRAFNFFSFSVFTLFLIISVTATLTGAFFNQAPGDSGAPADFGNIQLNQLSENFNIYQVGTQNTIGKILPEDSFDISFQIENVGTADMYVRFLPAVVDHPNYTLDTSNFTVENVVAYYAVDQTNYTINYIARDFGGTIYYVRETPMTGNSNVLTNDPPDNITVTYKFNEISYDPETESNPNNAFKDASLRFDLLVESIQYANNPGRDEFNQVITPIYDPTDPGYNIVWST